MVNLKLRSVVWKEGKFYVAQCLNVDISSFGKTRAEALKNLKEALELYFADVKPSKAAKVENPELKLISLQYA